MSNFIFEELETDIAIIAHMLCKQYCYRFDVHELINEAWVSGKYLNMRTKGLARQRAKWDMMDYIRNQVGRDIYKNYKRVVKPKFITNFTQREYIPNCLTDDYVFREDIFDKISSRECCIEIIDNKDLLKHFFSFLNQKDIEVISYYYMNELVMREISEKIGIGKSSVCVRLKKAIKKCRDVADELVANEVI